MAIIVDEGEGKGNILGIIGWVIFLGIAAGGIYYVFFAQPQLVTIPATGTLGTIAPIAQNAIQPSAVIQSAPFEALTSTISLPTPQGPAPVGRTDPFIVP